MTQNSQPGRKIAIADGDLKELLKLTCPGAVALEMGTEPQFFAHHIERFSNPPEKFADWLDVIAHVETGWINFADEKGVVLYWVSPSGQEVKQYDIAWGEPKTHWRTVYLDHKFRIKNSRGDLVKEMVYLN